MAHKLKDTIKEKDDEIKKLQQKVVLTEKDWQNDV